MKMNKRFIQIAILCFVVAIALSALVFNSMKKAAEPEVTQDVAYFKYNLEKDRFLKKEDIEFRATPISLIPRTALTRGTINENMDKRLIVQGDKGEMVLASKLIERGDTRIDVKNLWTIGLDVVNISSYMGGNLKEGKDYILIYKRADSIVDREFLIKIANMVDANGRIITETGEGLMKTINVSVQEKEDVLEIAQFKGTGSFELVDAPEGYQVPKEDQIIDQEDLEETLSN